MIEFVTPRRVLRAIASVAPAIDVRSNLVGVHVRADKRGVILEATDGHALARIRVSAEPAAATSAIIPLAALKPFITGGKKVLDQSLAITVTDTIKISDATVVLEITPYNDRYPDVDSVMKKALAAKVEMAQFDPRLLERLRACIAIASGAENPHPSYSQRGNQPCVVTSQDLPEFLGLVMPWRVDDITLPAWVCTL